MCQICGIRGLANGHRWPKPLEGHKSDIEFLVTSVHEEYATYDKKNTGSDSPSRDALLELLRLLAAAFEDLEERRQKWWGSPEKREQRRRLEEECDQKKLSQLHKINNDSIEKIEAMKAKLGLSCKWSLGMNGGLWELKEGDRVAKPPHQLPKKFEE